MQNNNNNITTFEAGQNYLMGWIGDADLKTPYTVLRRTAKSIWIKDVKTGEEITCRVKIHGGSEYVLPMGTYSMAPSLKASKKI